MFYATSTILLISLVFARKRLGCAATPRSRSTANENADLADCEAVLLEGQSSMTEQKPRILLTFLLKFIQGTKNTGDMAESVDATDLKVLFELLIGNY